MPGRDERHPGVRIVHYRMETEVTLSMEILLESGKADGTVTEGDCSSSTVWFEGRPGAAMRAFRNEMASLASAPSIMGGTPEAARLVRKYVRVRAKREAAEH